MQYIALIYTHETAGAPDPKMLAAYNKFNQETGAAGVLKGGDALQPSSTARCVSMRSGKRNVKDGPFSETKEQLAGYYILECQSLVEAIDFASKIPGAAQGTVEVRPILVM